MAYARYEYCDLSRYRRVIVMSDIHGMLEPFLAALSEVEFTPEDALVIVGDILEKGDRSLDTLREVYAMSARGNVFMVAGNNDTPFADWRDGIFTDADIHLYLSRVTSSVILDMARELRLPYSTVSEVGVLREAIFREYEELIRFLDRLPFIIETDFAVFVHAGIREGSLLEQDPHVCIYEPAFGVQKHVFPKTVVTGHWPASNYSRDIISVDPFYNRDTHVYCIDGGMGLKTWGQVNYLVYEKGKLAGMGRYDPQRRVRCLDRQSATDHPFSLIHPDTKLELLEDRGETVLGRLVSLGRELELEKNQLYTYKGDIYCADFTTYNLPVKAGEIVCYCEDIPGGILVKRNGLVGNYYGRYTFL